MKTNERLAVITEIAQKHPNIGKTGMMKFLYLLQAVYKLPLGYDFEIYTYGPYCQSVMSDIEYAEFINYIRVSPITYSSGMSGYQINAKDEGNSVLENLSDTLAQYSTEIDDVIAKFGNKTAKELELYSTVVFTALSFRENDWEKSKNEICATVKKIKPHFSMDIISKAYDELETDHFF